MDINIQYECKYSIYTHKISITFNMAINIQYEYKYSMYTHYICILYILYTYTMYISISISTYNMGL